MCENAKIILHWFSFSQFERFLVYTPGIVRFVSIKDAALRTRLMWIFVSVAVLLILVGPTAGIIWRRFYRRQQTYQAKLEHKYAEQERRIVKVFKDGKCQC